MFFIYYLKYANFIINISYFLLIYSIFYTSVYKSIILYMLVNKYINILFLN